jgi:hypothetical protein
MMSITCAIKLGGAETNINFISARQGVRVTTVSRLIYSIASTPLVLDHQGGWVQEGQIGELRYNTTSDLAAAIRKAVLSVHQKVNLLAVP